MSQRDIRQIIEVQEHFAQSLEEGARTMTAHRPDASALATAAVNVARADGIRRVTMHLRGAFGITVADLPEAGSPADVAARS
jgi:hypothetical protein